MLASTDAYEKAKAAEAVMDLECRRVAGRDWLTARYETAYDHDDALVAAKEAYDAACCALFVDRPRYTEPDGQAVLVNRDGVSFEADFEDVLTAYVVPHDVAETIAATLDAGGRWNGYLAGRMTHLHGRFDGEAI